MHIFTVFAYFLTALIAFGMTNAYTNNPFLPPWSRPWQGFHYPYYPLHEPLREIDTTVPLECGTVGQCIDKDNYLGQVPGITNAHDCLKACQVCAQSTPEVAKACQNQDQPECTVFSYVSSRNMCHLFQKCTIFDKEITESISGQHTCESTGWKKYRICIQGRIFWPFKKFFFSLRPRAGVTWQNIQPCLHPPLQID